jgi:uncharacterized protein YjbJ (UPF0337 family)
MDKDRIRGSVDQAKGKVKETIGDVAGDQKMKQEGKADRTAGKVKNTVGSAKDKVRESFNKD